MKVERILGIVMLLLNKQRVTAQELSEYFEVSQRTIKRDIEVLYSAGVPLVSLQGQGGGYELLDTYTIDRNFFSKDEGMLIKNIMENLEKIWNDKGLQGLNNKFRTFEVEKESPVSIEFSSHGSNNSLHEEMSILKNSIEERRLVLFQYKNNKGEDKVREVEPYKLLLKNGTWYLDGYCMEKNDFRRFRLIRMKNLKESDTKFLKRKYIRNMNGNGKEIDLELIFEPEAFVKLDYYFPLDSITKLGDGRFKVEVTYPEDEWVYSMLLGFWSQVTIVNPGHIREIVYKRAKAIVEKYNRY